MRSDRSWLATIRRVLGALVITAVIAPTMAATNTGDSGSPGSWQLRKYDFHFMGVTSTYSCDGLGDKLKQLLRLAGAREDLHVAPLCALGFGVPDRLAQATVSFSSLQPVAPETASSAGPTVPGAWHHVEFAPNRPYGLRDGDCELIEEFRDNILPMFATRNLQSRVTCIPNQATGIFSLQFDVFAPVMAAKAH